MSSLAFLVTELQSLASETRRKHPEIREAAEKSLAILRTSPEQATNSLASDGPQSDELLKPVFMGCATKNAKVVAISLGQGVDIQLRILQTLVSLITNFPSIHGALLGDALLLCFKLQESKTAVVSSTAAATLRQLVMFVVDKMVDEDRLEDLTPEVCFEVELPDGTTKLLGPSARDAFSIFEDLCLLANAEKPHFLKLEFLHKTFALELIESVLTNYHGLFRKHGELILLLQHHLCPLLLKSMSDRPVFPLTLRCTRVVFLLLKQFSFELIAEAEVFLMLIIKIIAEDSEHSSSGSSGDHHPSHANRPAWMRVLAMEIMRGLCSDAELMRNVWGAYDAHDNGSNIFTSLVTALKRLVTEKPAILGVGSQMLGVGVTSEPVPSSSSYGLDVGGMAGRVATAASATVSGVVGMIGSHGGLSLQGSAMKLQCIDQLDKADSPPIPESYIYLLGVQCFISLCEGFASFTGPLYTSIVIQKPRVPGDAVVRAPPALDLASLPEDEPRKQLEILRDMIGNSWPAFLAALSFIVSTNLSDDLFVDILTSYQAMTNVSGMLGLTTPRDAFFTSLAKFAVPTRVVSSLDSYSMEPQTPRSAITENFGLTAPTQPPGLSDRNMACLKVLIASALFLAGSLGESWFGVLEVLQNADYVLTQKGVQSTPTPSKRGLFGPGTTPSSRSVSHSGSNPTAGPGNPTSHGPRHPFLIDLEPDALQTAIQRLFEASKNLEDPAFKYFIDALCRLSSEMVGMQNGSTTLIETDSIEDVATSQPGLSPRVEAHRRRVSGIHLPRTLRSGDFGITKLGGVALLNIHRLIYRSPEIAWNTTTSHLLSVISLPFVPQSIRIQAARVLDEIILVVPRNLTTSGELRAEVQDRVLSVLSQQIGSDSSSTVANPNTSIELRRMGLETLHQILQASGHTLVTGWETIFQMLGSVCKAQLSTHSGSTDSVAVLSSPPSPTLRLKLMPVGLGNPSERSSATLVKIAFQSLTLVCDSISSLSAEHLRLCISTLGQFGRQADTNIALTAAASLLWSVSDAIQSKRKDVDQEPQYSEIWMFLLLEVLGLCADPRPEVRDGAIQTLFRTTQLYGSTLSLETWDRCIWDVIFPLLDSLTTAVRQSPDAMDDPAAEQAWAESKILALHSIGSLFHDFLSSKILELESFPKAWDVFVNHIQECTLVDSRIIATPALLSLERAIRASSQASAELKPKVSDAWHRVWQAINDIGGAIQQQDVALKTEVADVDSSHEPFTQESLVAFVDVIQSTRKVSRSLDDMEWPLDRLSCLMTILKGILMYSNSPDYRPDIDSLPPVQAAVIETITNIDLSIPGAPSLVMRDLSVFSTLPFLAAFNVPGPSRDRTNPKRVTYIALTKKVMPMLVDLFLKFKTGPEIYADGTLEAVLSSYSIPIKLKYDCPPPSKFGDDSPLWKTATTNFLKIVKECAIQLRNLKDDVPDTRVECIWRQVLDVFRGGILADCSAAETFPLDVQDTEENFDLALIGALEIDVVPHIGDSRVPDNLLVHLAKFLSQGSRLYTDDSPTPPSPDSAVQSPSTSNREEKSFDHGHTDCNTPVPRERFSFWCFDLLFLICSATTTDQELSRRRLAAHTGYVADGALRGNLPFPRIREDELIYVLRKLLELKLWPGSLWAAMSNQPSKYCVDQPKLISDAVKRSSVAHLFHFYPVLCEIASMPRKTPSGWVNTSDV
ncbi:guanine nucleotide exchange factor in Golgi transport N-terminal-domain-containing protein [Infundibulicybe gibba]|nr:guanine nucleotide exchange factor in Golgi transport N-terminal-domain-containing protein [Infundibulicybe gibba]